MGLPRSGALYAPNLRNDSNTVFYSIVLQMYHILAIMTNVPRGGANDGWPFRSFPRSSLIRLKGDFFDKDKDLIKIWYTLSDFLLLLPDPGSI